MIGGVTIWEIAMDTRVTHFLGVPHRHVKGPKSNFPPPPKKKHLQISMAWSHQSIEHSSNLRSRGISISITWLGPASDHASK